MILDIPSDSGSREPMAPLFPWCRLCRGRIEGEPHELWTYDARTGEERCYLVHGACYQDFERWQAQRGMRSIHKARITESN
jgi:hypothetical protein